MTLFKQIKNDESKMRCADVWVNAFQETVYTKSEHGKQTDERGVRLNVENKDSHNVPERCVFPCYIFTSATITKNCITQNNHSSNFSWSGENVNEVTYFSHW